MLIEMISGLGGFAGLGAMVASLATLAKTKKVQADTVQLRPNHGSSVVDKIDLIISTQNSHGHQLGEQHRLILTEIADRQALDKRAQLDHERLRDEIKKNNKE